MVRLTIDSVSIFCDHNHYYWSPLLPPYPPELMCVSYPDHPSIIGIFVLTMVFWLVIEIVHLRDRKILHIELQKNKMDGVIDVQRLADINNKNLGSSNQSASKPLLISNKLNNNDHDIKLEIISEASDSEAETKG
uniref:Uncharacterized protein n=1 Tax=Medioppia subpectinata TaxID=1979941 RepID=A0A7R9Q371_9ACAR|nr:unnamed protein product [Medioppia subpectinata]CAG2110149.1 unnamed protein product [Medioppia subpectinata]